MNVWIDHIQSVSIVALTVAVILLARAISRLKRNVEIQILVAVTRASFDARRRSSGGASPPAAPPFSAEQAARMAGAIPEETLSGLAGEERRL